MCLPSPIDWARPPGRMYPGRYLALAEIKMVTAMLLGSFAIEAITTPGGADAQERLALTMSPVGLQMWLRPSGDKACVS